MPKASDLKTGSIVLINEVPHVVQTLDAKSPSSRGAGTLYKVRFRNLKTGQKLDESFKGDDALKEADCTRKKTQFSYVDGENLVFMDLEDYSQYALPSNELAEQLPFMAEGLEGIIGLIMDGTMIGIELPATVNLQVIETMPSLKGGSASARTKPAKLTTGLEIQVPEYLEQGEVVKVNTETGKFISRA
jgi:elongation factor P